MTGDTLPWNADTAKHWEERNTMDNGGHDMIAEFLYAQIDLFAEMAYGRNYNVIHALEEMFPYVMLVGVISSTTLPFKIRGSLVKLMNRLWVDRYPSAYNVGRQSLPDVVWSFENLVDVDISDSHAFPNFQLHPENPLTKRHKPIYNISGPNKLRL